MFPVEVEFRGDTARGGGLAGDIVRRVRRLPESEHVSGGVDDEGDVHLVVFVCAGTPLTAERIVREGLMGVGSTAQEDLEPDLRCEALLELSGHLREGSTAR